MASDMDLGADCGVCVEVTTVVSVLVAIKVAVSVAVSVAVDVWVTASLPEPSWSAGAGTSHVGSGLPYDAPPSTESPPAEPPASGAPLADSMPVTRTRANANANALPRVPASTARQCPDRAPVRDLLRRRRGERNSSSTRRSGACPALEPVSESAPGKPTGSPTVRPARTRATCRRNLAAATECTYKAETRAYATAPVAAPSSVPAMPSVDPSSADTVDATTPVVIVVAETSSLGRWVAGVESVVRSRPWSRCCVTASRSIRCIGRAWSCYTPIPARSAVVRCALARCA